MTQTSAGALPLTVACFTFNSSHIGWCGGAKKGAGRKFAEWFVRQCQLGSEFVRDLAKESMQNRPTSSDILAISTQNEPTNQSFLHSELLRQDLQNYYAPVAMAQLEEVGDAIGGRRPAASDRVGGIESVTSNSLRMSIYVKVDKATQFVDVTRLLPVPPEESVIMHGRSMGYVARYIRTASGNILFINFHSSDILGKDGEPQGQIAKLTTSQEKTNYELYRAKVRGETMTFLSRVLERHLTLGKPIAAFVMGDFNLVIHYSDDVITTMGQLFSDQTAGQAFSKLRSLDELHALRKHAPYKFLAEGVGANDTGVPAMASQVKTDTYMNLGTIGPTFRPTWRMNRGRNPTGSQKCSSYDACYARAIPGWRDRIFFYAKPDGQIKITCTSYKDVDYGEMEKSEHNGVFGTYRVEVGAPAVAGARPAAPAYQMEQYTPQFSFGGGGYGGGYGGATLPVGGGGSIFNVG